MDADPTDFGVRVYGIRKLGAEKSSITIRNFIMPNLTHSATAGVNWHVPIDDTHHWKYCIIYNPSTPIDTKQVRSLRSETTDGYRLLRQRDNRYMQDRDEMRTLTFSGLGTSFQAKRGCRFSTGRIDVRWSDGAQLSGRRPRII